MTDQATTRRDPSRPAGRGRPALPAGQARTERLQIPLSSIERERLAALAKDAGLPLAAWARGVLLGLLEGEEGW